MSFAQGASSQPLILQGSNVFLYGSSTSGNAFTVQQQSAGNVASFQISSGSTALIINPSGYVGIGTTNPGYILDVNGSARFGTNTLTLPTVLATTSVGVGTTATPPNKLSVLSTTAQLASSVQISHPIGDWGLVVKRNVNDNGMSNFAFLKSRGEASTIITQGDGIGRLTWHAVTNATGPVVQQLAEINVTNAAFTGGNADGTMIFMTKQTGDSVPVERVRILPSGNVGIGTASPTKTLQVWGGMIIGASSDSRATTVTLNAPGATVTFTQNADIGDGARIMCLQCPDLSSTTANLVSFSLQVAPTGTFGSQRTSIDLKGFRVASQSYGGFCVTSPFDTAGAYDLFYADRTKAYFQQSVGIGTASPSAPLHVYYGTAGIPATTGSTDSNVASRVHVSSVAIDTGVTGPGVTWIQPRLYTNFATNYSLSLCPNGGNVGIGVITAGVKLDVVGNIRQSTFPVLYVYKGDGDQTVASGTAVTFSGTNYNTQWTRTTSSRFTLTGPSGYYLVTARIQSVTAFTYCSAGILVNGVLKQSPYSSNGTAANYAQVITEGVVFLNTNDYIEVFSYSSVSVVAQTSAATDARTALQAVYLSGTT